jgi:hypothetical protein
MDIPVILRRHAGIEPTGTTLPARESIAWLVRRGDQLAVLHRLDPVRWPAEDSDAHGEVAWLHDYLARLPRTTFPAPRPLPIDGQRSWTVYQDAIWELVSYLPGTVLGWRPQPSLTEVGALLAQFPKPAPRSPQPGSGHAPSRWTESSPHPPPDSYGYGWRTLPTTCSG